jgi:hypothetical protein
LSSAAHKTLSQIDFSQVQDDADKWSLLMRF